MEFDKPFDGPWAPLNEMRNELSQRPKPGMSSEEILKMLMSGGGGGGASMGRPDGTGGINHQGRAWAKGQDVAMKMLTGGKG